MLSRCLVITMVQLALTSILRADSVYQSYQTEITCHAHYDIEYPSTPADLRKIVARAIVLNTTVKAFGARHSVVDTICTDGIPVDMRRIKYVQVHADTHTVTAGAGAQLADFIAELKRHGRALRGHIPSYGGVTIGGALGTGARGSTLLHQSSLSDQVVGLKVINGLGEVIDLDTRSPDFEGFRVHLGLLGIIVDATFKTVQAYKMHVENYRVPDSKLFDGSLLRMAYIHDWTQFWWFPSSESVVVSKGTFLNDSVPGNAKTYNIPDVEPLVAEGMKTAFEKAQALRSLLTLDAMQLLVEKSLYQQVVFRQPVFSEDGGNTIKNPAVGYVHNLMSNRCTPGKCAWDQEVYVDESAFGLPIEEFQPAVRTIQSILAQYPASFPIYGIFIRFAPANTGVMSIEYGRDTVHIEIVTPMRQNRFKSPRSGLGAVQAIEQAMVFKHNGRPHWSMCGQAFHSRQMLIRTSPNLRKFQNLMKKYDPNGLFLNNFGRRALGVADTLTIDEKEEHCALLDNCFCAADSDCAPLQRCGQIYSFNVCKDILTDVLPQVKVVNRAYDRTLSLLSSIL